MPEVDTSQGQAHPTASPSTIKSDARQGISAGIGPLLSWVLAIAAVRLLVLAILTTFSVTPDEEMRARAYWHSEGLSPVGQRLVFRDPGAYLTLAEQGYRKDHWYSAFYPLWPWLLRPLVLSLPANLVPWGAWALANALTCGASVLLFILVRDRWQERHAWWSVAALNGLPTSLFLYLPYTEPLFVFLFCLLLWALHRDRWAIAAFCCLLMPMVRPVGVFLFPGLAWWAFTHPRRIVWALPPVNLLGFVLYLGWMHHATGNAFEGFKAQELHLTQASLGYLFQPTLVLSRFASVGSVLGPDDGLIDRLCLLYALVLLVVLYRLDRFFALLVIPMTLLPAITNLFMSYRRYMIVAVPLAIALAHLGQGTQRQRRLVGALMVAGVLCQLALLWEQVNGRWAG